MTGTLLNVSAVLVGGALGSLVGGRFPASTRTSIMQALGLVTVLIGLQRALAGSDVLLLLVSLVLGAAVGELLRIEDGLDRFGSFIERRARWREVAQPAPQDQHGGQRSGTARAFLTASLLFSVGPMTILGSFEEGLTGVFQTLAIKAALDGIAATVLASTLGWGVMLAATTVLVYQGALTLGAGMLRAAMTEPMITQVTAVGGVLIVGVGLNLLDVARVRVASMLPSLVVAPILTSALGRGG